MIIVRIPNSRGKSIEVLLEHAKMVFDPRTIGGAGYTFIFSVNGRTLTITRIDEDEGWRHGFYLRAYLPTEVIPVFTTSSTVYTYHGLEYERAPEDVTKVNIHLSVTVIQYCAFADCRSLVRITIPDTVTQIQGFAFDGCISLRFIRLSTNLEFIGEAAFCNCSSIEVVFLPPTVTRINDRAFQACQSLIFCILPNTIEHVGDDVFSFCDRLSTTPAVSNNFLSKVCYSTSVNHQSIQECIHTHGIDRATEVNDQQMTALHILCANPHVPGDCIGTYLQLAPEAAEQQDSDGMTPFQRLCRNDNTFFEDMSFSSVMAW